MVTAQHGCGPAHYLAAYTCVWVRRARVTESLVAGPDMLLSGPGTSSAGAAQRPGRRVTNFRKKASRRLLACGLVLSLVGNLSVVGCAGSPPATFYSLRPLAGADARGATTGGAIAIGLGPVTFPGFLDRPQIVSRDGTNGLTVDEFNRWGGTLQDDFLRVWSENLGYLLGTGRIVIFPSEIRYPLDFRISADVLSFEGAPAGEAVLKVRWAVLDPRLEQALSVHENSYRRPLRQPADQAALIGAMSAALGAFSEDVAAAVRGLPKPVSPLGASP
ncbi:PqiC family protein [uncultured Thiodictyon sp.]|uniref:PqiC family protein n=1 Tax=uncultured Thiodictyon sp. TaxID=1846217 RepID=UPI0025F6040F|nr:PqiC family protein [uncultured Thiodictyon sp.]